MNYDVLEGALCYLVGAIEFAGDQGKGWRRELVDQCKEAGLGIKFLDPTNKLVPLQKEIEEEHQKVVDLRNDGKFDELSKFMQRIVRHDHRCVDISDFVIFYLNPALHTCGSYFELQSALSQKKPYFLIVPGGKKKTPAWLFGILDHNNIFENVEQVVSKLFEINKGETELSNRWVLIRKELKKLEF